MTDLRHPRHARVRTGAEYERVFKRGKRVALPAAALHWCTSDMDAARAAPALSAPAPTPGMQASAVAQATGDTAAVGASLAAVDARARRRTGSPRPDTARLGLAVSRKVDPDAVGRNRIKRVWRDAFRHVRCQLAVADYVLVARPPCRDLDNSALRSLLLTLLRRGGALPLPGPAVTLAPASPDPASPAAAPTPPDSTPTPASAEPLRP